MALKSVVLSDISGQVVPDEEVARVVVSGHPATNGAVEIDLSAAEAELLQSIKLDLVNVTVHVPGGETRQVMIDTDGLCNTFEGVDVIEVLRKARRVPSGTSHSGSRRKPRDVARRPPRITRRRRPRSIDYADLRFAGNLHRGRVSDAEAAVVRENLEIVNERLAREGRPTIDPNDPVMKRRYRF